MEIVDQPTADEYYSQYNNTGKDYIINFDRKEMENNLEKCAKLLKKINCSLFYCGWPLVWNFIDNPEDDIKEYFDGSVFDQQSNYKYCYLFFTDNGIFNASCSNGELFLQHRIPKQDRKLYVKEIIETFEKIFGNRFKWDGKDSHTISIKMLKL